MDFSRNASVHLPVVHGAWIGQSWTCGEVEGRGAHAFIAQTRGRVWEANCGQAQFVLGLLGVRWMNGGV